MIGQTLGRFQIAGKLGEGGMGVVYRARDTRLNRTVALKVLPAAATADADRKQRFVQEAIAASALNHPHIVITYDIDAIDGIDVIAMEYIDGAPLDREIVAGGLPIDRVVEYALQITDAIAAAHRAGIIHRDLKPGNVMRTRDGQIKVLDFGLAKLLAPAAPADAVTATGVRPTGTGTVMGTAAYMAPEQAEGHRVTPAADVFAIGILLYELLTGTRPFHGESEVSLIASLLRDDPPPLRRLRPEMPPPLAEIVDRCLEKDPQRRYADAGAVHAALQALRAADPAAAASRAPRRLALAAVIALVIAAGVAWWLWREMRVRENARARLAEVEQLLDDQRAVAALELLSEIKTALPNDADVATLEHRLVYPNFTLTTDPPGATIEVQDYLDPGPWHTLGVTPLPTSAMPVGYLRLRATKAGYEPLIVGHAWASDVPSLKLSTADSRPAGMVWVAGGRYRYGAAPPVTLDPYWIDQFEVTNQQFKAFVDAGGYRRREFWTHPFERNGQPITFDEAMALFIDTTGRPGPATWELGSYPEGKGDEPVNGVSWYEAAAYAQFAGKMLPSFYHWYRAAGLGGPFALFSDVIQVSNYSGNGPAPVGAYRGLGPFGTFDLAGNVKEWCFNRAADRRQIAGGAWSEPAYTYGDPDAQDPLGRRPTYGFRTIKPAQGTLRDDHPAFAALPMLTRDLSREPRADATTFEAFKRLYAYDRAPLAARVEATSSGRWSRQETVSFDAAYGGERVIAQVFLPLDGAPPYQAVVHLPGSYAMMLASSRQLAVGEQYVDYLVRGGRAAVLPVLKGTYERRFTAAIGPHAARDLTIQWFKDVARTLDYLETRPDIDSGRVALHGLSMGATEVPTFAALDPRFKVAIAIGGGLLPIPRLPEAEQATFAPYVRQPFLIINGRDDFLRPYATSQLALLNLLGTPAADKRLTSWEGGHLPPRPVLIKETLDWLDEYLGGVGR